MKTFKIFGGFWGQNYFFWQISETRFSKQFSLKWKYKVVVSMAFKIWLSDLSDTDKLDGTICLK